MSNPQKGSEKQLQYVIVFTNIQGLALCDKHLIVPFHISQNRCKTWVDYIQDDQNLSIMGRTNKLYDMLSHFAMLELFHIIKWMIICQEYEYVKLSMSNYPGEK